MEIGIGPMRGLGADQDQGGYPVRRGACHFNRAGSAHRAADDDQPIAFCPRKDGSSPLFDRIAQVIERRRDGSTGEQIHLPRPHRTVEGQGMEEQQSEPIHTSRLATLRALSWINSRRGSTMSPIRVEKISSASSAWLTLTCNRLRTCGSRVVS